MEVLRRLCVCSFYLMIIVIIYFVSSPYQFVFDDDRVTRYTGVDDVSGEASEA